MKKSAPSLIQCALAMAGFLGLLVLVGCDSSSPAPPASGATNAAAGATNVAAGAPRAAVGATNAAAGATNAAALDFVSVFDEKPTNGRNPFFRMTRVATIPGAPGSEATGLAALAAPPKPKIETMLILSGIMGTSRQRVALINDRTFEVGDEATVRAGDRQAHLRCLEIGAQYAVVVVDGSAESLRLVLKKPAKTGGD